MAEQPPQPASTSRCCSTPRGASLAGQSPYDRRCSRAVARRTSLFYSYPPPVAQAMTLVRGFPTASCWCCGRRGDARSRARRRAVAVHAAGSAAADGGPGDGHRLARAPVRHRRPVRQPRRLVSARLRAVLLAVLARLVVGGRGSPAAIALGHRVRRQAPSRVARSCGSASGPGVDRGAANARQCCVAASPRASRSSRPACSSAGVRAWLDYVAVVRAGAGRGHRRPAEHRAGVADRSGRGARRGPLRGSQVGIVAAVVGVTLIAALRVRDPSRASAMAIAAVARHAAGHLVPLPGRADAGGHGAGLLAAGSARLGGPERRGRRVAVGFTPLLWVAVGVLMAAEVRRAGAPGPRCCLIGRGVTPNDRLDRLDSEPSAEAGARALDCARCPTSR